MAQALKLLTKESKDIVEYQLNRILDIADRLYEQLEGSPIADDIYRAVDEIAQRYGVDLEQKEHHG